MTLCSSLSFSARPPYNSVWGPGSGGSKASSVVIVRSVPGEDVVAVEAQVTIGAADIEAKGSSGLRHRPPPREAHWPSEGLRTGAHTKCSRSSSASRPVLSAEAVASQWAATRDAENRSNLGANTSGSQLAVARR